MYSEGRKPFNDVRANCFCASLLRTRITCQVMPRHASSVRARYKNEQMIGQMAIATALLGFNDLGRSVTPSFLFFSFQKQILFTIIYTLSKNEKKNQCGKLKKNFKISVHGTWNPAISRLQGE